MFAVPGWAVSTASLTRQTDPKSINAQKAQEGAVIDSSAKLKKRKRSEGERAPQSKVSSEELESLWNKQFGDQSVRVKSKKSKIKAGRFVDGAKIIQPPEAAEQMKSNAAKHAKISSFKPIGNTPREDGLGVKEPLLKDRMLESASTKKWSGNTRNNGQVGEQPNHSDNPANPAPTAVLQSSNLTPLQAKMRSKLTSARFRHLNQTLYTTSSTAALELFNNSPDLFAEYHAGFSQQVKDSWPENPVDIYVQSIRTRGRETSNTKPLPRRKTGSCTIADLGCGDAPLARGCQSHVKALQLKFHNFDLHSPNAFVTKADISNLPLRDGEADIAVFCLSLMGTNWPSFVEEAWRILRGDGQGEVWVAEVKSRFGRGRKDKVVENSVGKKRKPQRAPKEDEEDVLDEAEGSTRAAADETDISAFVDVFQRRGFELRPESVEKGNKMFVSMIFVKSGIPTAGEHKGKKWNGKEYRIVHDGKMRYAVDDETSIEEEVKVLKPCVYKTR